MTKQSNQDAFLDNLKGNKYFRYFIFELSYRQC